MEHLNACPACGHSSFKRVLTCTDHTVSKEPFQLVECNACQLWFTNPRPSIQEIGRYYESDEYISHSNSSKGVFNKVYQLVRKLSLKRKLKGIEKYVPSGGLLLDIGCGTGEFLNHVQQSNTFLTLGIEPDAEARAFARNAYNLEVNDESFLETMPNQYADVVTMWHVLEHVHELNKRIETIYQLLKPSGVVFIAVPNPQSLDAQHYKQYWAGYDVPRHLYHFAPDMLRSLFEKHHFEHVSTHILPFDSFYVSLLSEKYAYGKMRVLSGLWQGLRSFANALKNEDVGSSQVYIFRKKAN